MNKTFILDGIKYRERGEESVEKKEVEIVPSFDRNESPINLPVELAETIKELNNDELEQHFRMTKIDLKARLTIVESAAILAYDTLVQLKFLPRDALFLTRQRKRLSVSEEGKGREEIVRIVEGKRERDENMANAPIKKVGFMQGKK